MDLYLSNDSTADKLCRDSLAAQEERRRGAKEALVRSQTSLGALEHWSKVFYVVP